jgi:hypothetical protein
MKPALRITRQKDQASDDLRYWLSRSVAERIAAVEQLRRGHEGVTADAEPRLQRVVASFNAHRQKTTSLI